LRSSHMRGIVCVNMCIFILSVVGLRFAYLWICVLPQIVRYHSNLDVFILYGGKPYLQLMGLFHSIIFPYASSNVIGTRCLNVSSLAFSEMWCRRRGRNCFDRGWAEAGTSLAQPGVWNFRRAFFFICLCLMAF
jgi:hypothetical protein